MRVTAEKSYAVTLSMTEDEHGKIITALSAAQDCLAKAKNPTAQNQGVLLGVVREALSTAVEETTEGETP